MKKIVLCFAVLFIACEDALESDPVPEYGAAPVVEVCTDTLCFSEAVPLLAFKDLENDVWPDDGISIEEHKEWCDYHTGWRMPRVEDIETLKRDVDDYTDGVTYIVGEHVQKLENTEAQYLFVPIRSSLYPDFFYFARCVKQNAEQAEMTSQ